MHRISRKLKVGNIKRLYNDTTELSKLTNNQKLIDWVKENAKLCQPKDIHICTGSEEENQKLLNKMVESKTLIKLTKRENCYLARSDPDDVARVEKRTFICSEKKKEAGPTNNWANPKVMKERLNELFTGSMKGRTMYVIPYSMGPIGGNISKIGVEITDSPYVAASMRVMTRIGKNVLDQLGNGFFVPCLHSSGQPINKPEDDVSWPCNPIKYISHFPEERSIFSYGSSYGGNALLGKKCLSLRIASVMGRDEGWLAEHMLILGITNPEGKKKYIAAAFPSACGKTNLAMLTPTIPGWKVETVGDDIAWMKFGNDGRLYAINPEFGFFGVAPGTSMSSNPNAMKTIEKNTIFTNVGLTPDGDVWWEKMTKEKPKNLTDWYGKPWTSSSKGNAAHGNSRFCTPITQCPILDPNWNNPSGVPIDAILFGGRRNSRIPLVMQSYNWAHGTLYGASVSSEQTEAAENTGKSVRHDPFAMLPFAGYNMGHYFNHWLKMGKKTTPDKLPKIFTVNWFKKDQNGEFLWPGFGENSRVLKWIFERTDNKPGIGKDLPIGVVPSEGALDTKGLDISKTTLDQLFEFRKNDWGLELEELSEYFSKTYEDAFPLELGDELNLVLKRMSKLN